MIPYYRNHMLVQGPIRIRYHTYGILEEIPSGAHNHWASTDAWGSAIWLYIHTSVGRVVGNLLLCQMIIITYQDGIHSYLQWPRGSQGAEEITCTASVYTKGTSFSGLLWRKDTLLLQTTWWTQQRPVYCMVSLAFFALIQIMNKKKTVTVEII